MRRALAAAVLGALCACAHAPAGSGAGARAAELAFDAASGARDAAAFGRLVCADAVFGGRVRLQEGREAVVAAWTPFLSAGGPSLRWVPTAAGEAASGDLAWTTGDWTFRGKDGEARGRYATVWRREGDGWCALFDMGQQPPGAAGAVREPLRTARSAAGELEAELGRWRSPAGQGAYLVVRRRTAAGLETVLETEVAFAAP